MLWALSSKVMALSKAFGKARSSIGVGFLIMPKADFILLYHCSEKSKLTTDGKNSSTIREQLA